MSDIKEAIAILRARWPDVVLIIGLHVLSMLLNRMFLRLGEEDAFLQTMNLVCMLAYLVAIPLLMIAFERAVYLHGGKRQSPIELLRAGRRFFGRAIRFGLLYLAVYFILASMIFSALRRPIGIDAGFWQSIKTAPFLYYLCSGVSTLILIKPLLLVTPIIVVRDCQVLTSLRVLRRYRLSDSRWLVLLFSATTAISVLWAFLPSPESGSSIFLHVLAILFCVTLNLVGLTTTVMAVRFVSSHDPALEVNSGLADLGALSD